MTDVLTFGECLLALRSRGGLRAGAMLATSVAGAESNVAIGLSRLGHQTTWVGLVGQDAAGALIQHTLRSEGVTVAAKVVDGFTGIVLFEPRPPIGTRVDYHRAGSAGSLLRPADLLPHLERAGARILHVSGVTPALSASASQTVSAAITAARAAGVWVSFDVNYRARLWSREQAAVTLRPLIDHVDLLIASEDELDLVAGSAEELHARGVSEVVVKRGAGGATVSVSDDAQRTISAPAVSVHAIDPVGAGDAFTAGYLSATLDGLGPGDRLARGNEVGAFAVSTDGDWEGLPSRDELDLLGVADGTVHR